MNSPVLKDAGWVDKDLRHRHEIHCCRKSLNYAVWELLDDAMDKSNFSQIYIRHNINIKFGLKQLPNGKRENF